MEELTFSHNWNKKLDCDCFTSIRLSNDRKYEVGKKYLVKLGKKGHAMKTYPRIAVLKAKNKIRIADIKEYMAMLDTGYGAEQTKNLIRDMYKFKEVNIETAWFDYLLFAYSDESSEVQGTIDYGNNE